VYAAISRWGLTCRGMGGLGFPMHHGIVMLVPLLLTVPCRSDIITVDDDGPADFANIQAAIDNANDMDTIIVEPGLYGENTNFLGKNVTLMSKQPGASSVSIDTIIDGSVTFRGTEEQACVLAGFRIDGVVTGFDRMLAPAGENHARATINHCLIENVVTGCGRVMEGIDGIISNCVIANISNLCLAPWAVMLQSELDIS